MRLRILTLASVLTFASFAFASDGGSSTVGPAHDSSAYCKSRGGIESIVDINAFGGDQSSVCRMGDDAVVETMTLWRSQVASSRALAEFKKATWHEVPHRQMASWAAAYCQDVGGRLKNIVYHLRPAVTYQLCSFSDGSAIETWTLFAGPSYYSSLAK